MEANDSHAVLKARKKSRFAGSKDRFIAARHVWGPFGLGVLFVVLAHATEIYGPVIFPSLEVHDPYDSHRLTRHELLVLYLKELGIAFLVAGIIIGVVEQRVIKHDSERADRLRRQVAHDAIFSIYGLRHRTDFINAAVETNLQAPVVRENLKMHYEVRPPTKEEAELVLPGAADEALQRFVVMEMELSYAFKNVASKEIPLTIPYTVPLRQGSGARKLTRVTWARIGGRNLSDDEIADASEARAEELVYHWERTLAPGELIEVNITAQCLKERSDAEVWGCLFPTMGDVNLRLKVPEGLHFGVRDHSNASLAEMPGPPNPTAKTWTMSGPLLTHNSIIFWWRIPEDDAMSETSEPAEFSEVKTSSKVAASAEPKRGLLSWFFQRL